jgi:predicted permease
MWTDIREASRLVRRNPTVTAVAILVLGSGIGAATAIFALVHGVLLDHLPFREPDRLVWMYNLRTERDRAPLSLPDLQDYQRGATTIEALAPFTNWTANLTGAGEAERLEGTRVAGSFFEVLGARAAIGRTLQPEDARDGRAVVLTDRLWNRRFARDPSIIGRSITLNGTMYLIVGVLPRNFMFPFRQAEVAVSLPLETDPRRGDRGANFLRVVARLRPGVSIDQAKADLDRIAQRLQRDYPIDDARKMGVSLYPLHAEIVRDYRRILWTLFVAVGVLLAIGAGNLANLLLIRGMKRTPEISLRLALGATRSRVVRLLMTEGALLAIAGGLVGVAIATASLPAWRLMAPADFPRLPAVSIHVPVIVFSCLLSIVVGVIAGAIPAWGASRDISSESAGSARITSGRQQGLLRRAFVLLQLAGSTALVICMATAGRALTTLGRYDPGFTPDDSLTVQLSLPPARYNTRATLAAFHDALQQRLSSLPGSPIAGAVSLLPLSGLLSTADVAFPDRPAPPPDEIPQAHVRVAGPAYFRAAGIRIIAGREFEPIDRDESRPVAIVSETFARRHWPTASAIGQHLSLSPPGTSPPMEVVGVTSDVKQFGIDGDPTADLYVPVHQMPAFQIAPVGSRMYWVVRTNEPGRLLPTDLRRTIYELDPDIAASSVQSLSQVLAGAMAATRAHVLLIDVFGYVALFLTVLGVYGATSYAAGTRRRDLAIRAAFGASVRQLRVSMIRGELWPIAVGLVIGIAAGFIAVPAVLSSVSATVPRDLSVFVYASIGMLVVSIGACYVAASRAGWTEPADLLRG